MCTSAKSTGELVEELHKANYAISHEELHSHLIEMSEQGLLQTSELHENSKKLQNSVS